MLQTPKVFLLNASRPIFAVSVNFCSLSFQNLSMALSKVVAEYAKSNRSMCKTCSEAIQSKTLRLGLVSRDMARRLDITKWHHLSCFPISSSNSDPESITGFSSLKVLSLSNTASIQLPFFFLECLFIWFLFIYFQSGDQEALTKLFAGQDKSEEVRAPFFCTVIILLVLFK